MANHGCASQIQSFGFQRLHSLHLPPCPEPFLFIWKKPFPDFPPLLAVDTDSSCGQTPKRALHSNMFARSVLRVRNVGRVTGRHIWSTRVQWPSLEV